MGTGPSDTGTTGSGGLSAALMSFCDDDFSGVMDVRMAEPATRSSCAVSHGDAERELDSDMGVLRGRAVTDPERASDPETLG